MKKVKVDMTARLGDEANAKIASLVGGERMRLIELGHEMFRQMPAILAEVEESAADMNRPIPSGRELGWLAALMQQRVGATAEEALAMSLATANVMESRRRVMLSERTDDCCPNCKSGNMLRTQEATIDFYDRETTISVGVPIRMGICVWCAEEFINGEDCRKIAAAIEWKRTALRMGINTDARG